MDHDNELPFDPQKAPSLSIAVVSLGRFGLSLAAVLAKRFKVVGIEPDPNILRRVQDGVSPYREPGLQKLLTEVTESSSLLTVQRPKALLELPPVTIIANDLSTDKSGLINLSSVIESLRSIAPFIGNSDSYHTIVISTPIIPGFCQHAAVDYLEKGSNKKVGQDFDVCYVPANVRTGNIVDDLLFADPIIIGRQSDRAVETILPIYAGDNHNVIITSLINAEISKLATSCLVATKIAVANEFANLCERIPGADIDVVTGIIGMDDRISEKCLNAGAPFGGRHLPAEVGTALRVASSINTTLPVIERVMASNSAVAARVLNIITTELLKSKNRRVAILGLSSKRGLTQKDNSLGSIIAENLKVLGVTFKTFDPFAVDKDSAKTAQAAVNGAGVILVANDDPAFYNLRYNKNQLVIDVWRCLSRDAVRESGAQYLALGVG